ncbi:MAG TPA: hypothetical protein VHE34_28085 [Puia sp.]|uniref:hypothetical protein n=1 Tax=Puia sp. TaxID=2045100 RepID=UPI002BE25AE4|nr:hypothetical protein [Puia sp.]HVU99127.1 hypothetical protein [Puia sp.]
MSKKFKENLNTAVFTSDYVLSGSSPIVYIAHHEDGSWEFWSKETISESDVRVVSLQQIIAIDPSVLEVADLPLQFAAVRDDISRPWNLISKN